jgi:hypothetical protein
MALWLLLEIPLWTEKHEKGRSGYERKEGKKIEKLI